MILTDLPSEIITLIVKEVYAETVIIFSSTCSRYRVFRWDTSLWSQLILRDFSHVITKIPKDVDLYYHYRYLAKQYPTFYVTCFHVSGGWTQDDDFIFMDESDVDKYIDWVGNHHNCFVGDLIAYRFKTVDNYDMLSNSLHSHSSAHISNNNYLVSELNIPTIKETEDSNTSHQDTRRSAIMCYDVVNKRWIPVSSNKDVKSHLGRIPKELLFGYCLVSDRSLAQWDKDRIAELLSYEPVRTSFFLIMMLGPDNIPTCYNPDNFKNYVYPTCCHIYETCIPPEIRVYLDSMLKSIHRFDMIQETLSKRSALFLY